MSPLRIWKTRSGLAWNRIAAAALLSLPACGGEPQAPVAVDEALSGGKTTVFDVSREAYSNAAGNLLGERRETFFAGNSFFKRKWVTAPASTEDFDGLGPTFNARSCDSCHQHDGRGAPPLSADDEDTGLLVRLSIPGENAHGGPLPEPAYGDQFNPKAILGVPSEGTVTVQYEEVAGTFADGTGYSLRRPSYVFSELAFGPFAEGTMTSPRVAPPMYGLGLLEAVPESTLLALTDPDDRNGDGISGRPNQVWDVKTQTIQLGRFGWKANQPSLEQQNSGAFVGDMGLTSPLFPDENCPVPQVDCAKAPNGGRPEVRENKIEILTHYSHLLAVPARRDVDQPDVLRGKALFNQLGCASCHTPKLVTGVLAGVPEVSEQTIQPYSDLLLHDMGPELADGRTDFQATGAEWRTPPLWGIGLLQTVNRHTFLLHDGRARDLTEAILWHGGEGEASREAFKALGSDERQRVIRFLESL